MFKVLTKGCEPSKGSKYSAGIDLHSSEDCIIAAGETKIIGLGVCIDLDFFDSLDEYNKENFSYSITSDEMEPLDAFLKTHYLELQLQRSISTKGLISNTDVIDLDYEDEIKIIIHNPYNRLSDFDNTKRGAMDKIDFYIFKGDKIAQILLKEHKGYLLGVESDEERNGDFGSTGK